MVNHWWYRLAIAPLAGLGGWWLAILAGSLTNSEWSPLWGVVGVATGAFVGILVAPYIVPLVLVPFAPLGRSVSSIPFTTLVSGTAGLVVGLTIAALLSVPISRLPEWPGVVVPVALTAVLGLAGLAVGVARERDVSQLVPERARRADASGRAASSGRVLMDTSAIIDGRIADISKSGFVQGTMVIPRFILDELRHVADSSDSLKRARGRRGLEILNKLRNEAEIPIQIMDVDYHDGSEVDGKLVRLARNLNAQIMTTDFNLNRVAELQGVRVLNVNELANALKPVVLPGEEMMVRIIQEGKEYGQGVGFLDDGTMVVVEGGRKHINTHLDVSITRVLQTAAGRIIFAQPQVG